MNPGLEFFPTGSERRGVVEPQGEAVVRNQFKRKD